MINWKKQPNNVFINAKINIGIIIFHLMDMKLRIRLKKYVLHNKIVKMLLLINNNITLLTLYKINVFY